MAAGAPWSGAGAGNRPELTAFQLEVATSPPRDALEAAAREQGWSTERIHDSDTFCRLVIRSAGGGVVVDLAMNAPPDFPASVIAAELRAFYATWRSELSA